MDPISLSLQAIGLGMQIFGGMSQSQHAKEASEISKDEAMQEQGINSLKQRQMELEAKRTQLENIRNNQRARAMATEAAVNQGAQFGTGLLGGLAQINDQTDFNMLGVNQGLEIGRGINQFNQKISQDKMRMADVQSSMATDQGWQSLGGSLLKAGPTIGA